MEKSYSETVNLAKNLMEINTINGLYPEKPAIDYVEEKLKTEGISTERLFLDENRPNLLARIKGKGKLPPLLLTGHCDVVAVEGQDWEEDPFGGVIKDGYLWGRGAIDMKGQLAMFLSVMLTVKRENIDLPFDLLFLVVSDEEGDSDYGMKYLVENHPEIFQGIKYAISEIGGFSLLVSGKKFYPIMIGEKQFVQIKVITKSQGGHAAMAKEITAMEKMAKIIENIQKKTFPLRITEDVKAMIVAMGDGLGGVKGRLIKGLTNAKTADLVLKIMGEGGSLFDPLLRNKATVTMIRGGEAINVIPSEVSCYIDMRLVPGLTLKEGLMDLRKIIGKEGQIQAEVFDMGRQGPADLTLFSGMAETLQKADSQAVPVPFVLAAVTDARFLSRVGIQTYGFTPMDLPEEYDFVHLSHNANERVPTKALDFGYQVLMNYITQEYEKNA